MKLIFSTFWKENHRAHIVIIILGWHRVIQVHLLWHFFHKHFWNKKLNRERERERERERGCYLWLGFYWCQRRWATPRVVGNQSENRKRMVSMFQTKWVTVQNGFNVSDEVVKMGTEPTDPIIQIYFPQKKKIILIYDK